MEKGICDEVLNYKTEDFKKKLGGVCAKGVDCYFDSVGEETLDEVIKYMKENGRIALCGAVSSYDHYNSRRGIGNSLAIISKRLEVRGFFAFEFVDQLPNAMAKLLQFTENNQINLYDTVFQGLEEVPSAIAYMYKGENIGKVVVAMHSEKN